MSQTSSRADRFLKTLDRRPAISPAEAASRLGAQNIVAHDAWLEMHGRYAGYVQPLGLAVAVWGVVHDNPHHLPSHGFDFDTDADGAIITCADAHPSFDFWLDETGSFLGIGGGGPCASFTKHVEQLALFQTPTGSWNVLRGERLASAVHAIAELPADAFASDAFSKWWRLPELIVCKHDGADALGAFAAWACNS